MGNEITEQGQIAVYGGPQITLLGSDLGNALKSLLAREGSGAARGWKLFDPTKPDFLNTKKVLNPGDFVLVNAKALPMDFAVQTAGPGGAPAPQSYLIDGTGVVAGETTYGYLWPNAIDDLSYDAPATLTVSFSAGTGTAQASFDAGQAWQNINAGLVVPPGTFTRLQILHADGAAFSATATFAF